jgi:hypothetical protein
MDKLLSGLIRNPLVRAYLLSWLRHGLTWLGGLVLAHGWATSNELTKVIGGAMTMAGIILSQYDVAQVDAKIEAAVALAPQTPAATIVALKNGKF